MPFKPEDHAAISQRGGLAKSARTPDGRAATAAATAAAYARFEREVREELPDAGDTDVARMAGARRRLYMSDIGRRGGRARRRAAG
jgi:hypothetical protein